MVFNDLSLNEIQKTISKLRDEALFQDSQVREKLRDFYAGRSLADVYLANWGFKRKDGKTDIPSGVCNITRKVIDRISMVYKYAPDRYLDLEKQETESEDKDSYEQWLDYNPLFNITLKVAERQKNLLGHVLFRPVYDKRTERWKFFVETEYQAHFLADDSLHPTAYSWPLKQNVNDPLDVKEEWFVFWSPEYYFFYNSNGRIRYDEDFQDGVNPFGILPFIEMQDGVCVEEYPASQGAIELVQANEQINVALMDLNQMIHLQAFDQPYVSGVDSKEANNIKLGPNTFVSLSDPNATMGLLGYNPKIVDCVEAIRGQIQLISWSYNLSVNWGLEGTPASGFSLVVQNIDLLEARHDDVEQAEVTEKELYDVLATMQEYYKSQGLCKDEEPLPDANVVVDFAELDFPINQKEELERWDWEIQRNASSVVDYIQSKEGLSEEEAIERFNRNKKLNGQFSYADKIRERLEGFKPKEGELPVE